jgi:hypothetical protein
MDNITPAVIAVSGVLIVGYITNFAAEDFRRFRDGAALAAALAGELGSHATAFPKIREILERQITSLDRSVIRNFDPPNDPIFDNGVGKLGLVGHAMAEEIAFVYQQIRAFRLAYSVISKSSKEMDDSELRSRHEGCLHAIHRAEERGKPLIINLKRRANKKILAAKGWVLSSAVLLVVTIALSMALNRIENQRYALSLGIYGEPRSQQVCLQNVETRTHWWWHLYYAFQN